MRKLAEQGYEVFLPSFTLWTKARAKWSKKQVVMFPRYAFVRCGRPQQGIGPIRSTPGVTKLVSFGYLFATLGDETVEAIRVLSERQARAISGDQAPFEAGDAVRICDGPLKGLSGIVSSVASDRVNVLLTLLGREKAVAMPTSHLLLG